MIISDYLRSRTSPKTLTFVLKLFLTLPGLFCLIFFLAIPCLSLCWLSFASRGQYGDIAWTFTFENYKRLVGFNLFGWNPDFLFILLRSLREAFVTTFVCALLSYPLSFYIASRKTAMARFAWLILISIPFCTNVVIRTYGWQLVLGPELPFAKLATYLGLIPPKTPLYPGSLAVYLGMVSTFLPFMALPLYSAVERLNWSLPLAAKDLYASRVRIFFKTIFPQTAQGLYAGIVITFVPAMAMFVVTDILGGAKYMLVGNIIQHQFSQARDWPFGATLSLALMVLTLLSVALFQSSRLSRKGGGNIYAAL
ncbi:MAG: ABC transporter permease [Deltaproteobacteria bacterium]|jgi:spermidine/putrescine transport system permease protein|nr:ABC transporter permease [Deltaproteobacteria bacterium]